MEDNRRSAVIALSFAATAPVQVMPFANVFAYNGERAMLVVSMLALLVDLIGLLLRDIPRSAAPRPAPT